MERIAISPFSKKNKYYKPSLNLIRLSIENPYNFMCLSDNMMMDSTYIFLEKGEFFKEEQKMFLEAFHEHKQKRSSYEPDNISIV